MHTDHNLPNLKLDHFKAVVGAKSEHNKCYFVHWWGGVVGSIWFWWCIVWRIRHSKMGHVTFRNRQINQPRSNKDFDPDKSHCAWWLSCVQWENDADITFNVPALIYSSGRRRRLEFGFGMSYRLNK